MQQQQTQRRTLENLLAQLEYKQRITQREIISTQVQLELLNQRELQQTHHTQNTQHIQQTTTTNQYNNNSSSSSDENNIEQENNQNSDKSDSDSEEVDSNADSQASDIFRFPEGNPIYTGDKVIILNPTNEHEKGGVIIGSTPKRLQIKLDNGNIVLRQPENLEKAQTL
jgi:hypothetical protein